MSNKKENAAGLGSTDHDKGMIAKAENSDLTQPAPVENENPELDTSPSWLPEKYKTVREYLKGNEEREKLLGARESEDVEGATDSNAEGNKNPLEIKKEDTEEEVKQLEVLKPFHDEYAETGELSEDSYKALDDMGLNKSVVDTYISGLNKQVEQTVDVVGGQEEFDAMAAWASENLSDQELSSYNKQINQGDSHDRELAVRGLYNKYQESGEAPVNRYRGGDKPQVQGRQPFLNQSEVQIAMSDKRYRTSETYREEVNQRLLISDNAAMGASLHPTIARHG